MRYFVTWAKHIYNNIENLGKGEVEDNHPTSPYFIRARFKEGGLPLRM